MMKRIAVTLGVVAALLALSAACFERNAHAADRKKVTWNGKSVRLISETKANPGDPQNREIVQSVRLDGLTSTDPNFDGIDVHIYEQDDQIAGTGTHRGYTVYLHKNGDKSFDKFEGTHRTITKDGGAWETPFEGRGQFIGGTGKFKDIQGIYTYTGKITPEGGVQYVQEGEVQY